MARKQISGAPRKLDDAKKKKLLQFIASGKRGLRSAAAAVGVSYQTIRNECKRDRSFDDQVKQAKAERIGKLEELAFAMAPTEPKIVIFLLSHLCPEMYANREDQRPSINAPTIVITDPETVRSRLIELAREVGVEGVVDAVRVEQKKGHHKANGNGGGAHPAGS